MTPRVSVVIPAYNNADYIVETVESVLGQAFRDFEVVIADHSSTDATWKLLQRYDGEPRVRLLTTESGGGAVRNWNRVSQEAQGELLKLVCGDDIIYPDLLQRQVDAIDSAGDRAVLVACQRDLVDAQGKPIVSGRGLARLSGVVPGRDALRRAVRQGTNIFGEPCCVLFRRDALEKTGWWGDGKHAYLIDEAAYARVLMLGALVAIPEPLAAFRISAGQWSVNLMRQQYLQAAEFHHELRAADPTLLSPGDVRLGNVKARLLALQRRAVYAWLGRRMKPA